LDSVRNRELVADRRQPALGERAPDLEREQRVAERGVDEPAQELPRQRQSQPLRQRSEEHTSELQSPYDLVCRLLLEKKKNTTNTLASRLPDCFLLFNPLTFTF